MTSLGDFTLNGCREPLDEPYPYLDQAHGVLACLEEAVQHDIERGPLNPLLIQSAVKAVSTLIYLSAMSLDAMDKKTQARRG